MAIELSPEGVKVVCVRTSANPASRNIQDLNYGIATMMNITRDQANASPAEKCCSEGRYLHAPTDTANTAAFLASDQARMMTGTVLKSLAGVVTLR